MEKFSKIFCDREFSFDDCKKLVYQKFRSSEIENINFEIFPQEEKFGYLGDHFRINIQVTLKTQKITIPCFSKSIPLPESGIDLDLSIGAFQKEIFIYEKIFQKIHNSKISILKSVVPKCYFTKENSLLIFEDLSKSDFRPLTRYDFLNFDHVRTIIKSLAKFHSSSLIFEEKFGKIFEDLFAELDETFYSEKEGHKGTRSLFAALKGLYTEIEIFNFDCGSMSKETFKEKLDRACKKIFELIKPSKKYRNVVCHGDLWQTNFLMKYEKNCPVECKIVDFQTSRYHTPAHDVVAFLYLTTSRIFRKRHFQELLDLYYSELSKNCLSYGVILSNIISYPDFLESCEEQKLFGSLQAATYFQLTHVRADSIQRLTQDRKLWEDALYEDHSILVLDNIEHDLDYRYRLHESLKDLRDVLEKIEF